MPLYMNVIETAMSFIGVIVQGALLVNLLCLDKKLGKKEKLKLCKTGEVRIKETHPEELPEWVEEWIDDYMTMRK